MESINDRKNTERESKVLTQLKKDGINAERVRIFYLRNEYENIDIVKVYIKSESDENKIYKTVSDKLGCDKTKIKIYLAS